MPCMQNHSREFKLVQFHDGDCSTGKRQLRDTS